MKIKFLVLLFLIHIGLLAQSFDESRERDKIKQTIAVLVEGWSEGSGEKFASVFTEDADFMVWLGLFVEGKKAIADGHDYIFNSFYANTVWQLELNKIKFIDENIALAHCEGAITKKGETQPEEPDAVPLVVLKKIEGEWKIMVFQNTPYLQNEFYGDLRVLKEHLKKMSEN